MFKAPFSFEGRIGRTELWLTYVFYLAAIVIIAFVSNENNLSPLFVLFIPLVWFFIAQRTKRCHDQGNSGWFQLIPFYGLWMLFADGDHGDNYYGPDPKGRMTPVEDEDYYYKNPEVNNVNPPQE